LGHEREGKSRESREGRKGRKRLRSRSKAKAKKTTKVNALVVKIKPEFFS
jgi:hypothetical protein